MTVETPIKKTTALELFRRGVRLIKTRKGAEHNFVYLVRGQVYYTTIPHNEMLEHIRSIEGAETTSSVNG